MNVLIVGHGFVGKAISGALKSDVDLSIADPNLGNDQYKFKENNIDIIFICLPTPMYKDGDCNSSIVEAEMKISNELFPEALKVIKSTLPPNKLKEIEQKYSLVVYNPEFLTEKNAISDFIHSDFQIFGGNIKFFIGQKKKFKKINIGNLKTNISNKKIKQSINGNTNFVYIDPLNSLKFVLNKLKKDKIKLNKDFYVFTGSTVGIVPILGKGLYIGKVDKLGSVKAIIS